MGSWILKYAFSMAVLATAATQIASAATAFAWTGGKQPTKTPNGHIGVFTHLADKDAWANFVYNINNKYPASRPWIHWGLGNWREDGGSFTALSDEKNNEYIAHLNSVGVDVYLEARNCGSNGVDYLDAMMKKFGHHPNVKGFGFDLEYYKGGCGGNGAAVSDADAQALDEKLKSFNPNHRLFFKHWLTANMPPTYRGKGDMIFVSTSSESPIPSLVTGHSSFANAFATGAKANKGIAFQMGYPHDYPSGNHPFGGNYAGWGELENPVKNWGDQLLAKITSTTQELGIVWVMAKGNTGTWDATKNANLPTFVAASAPSRSRFMKVERNGSRLTVKLADGSSLVIPAAADIMGRKVTLGGAVSPAAGRYLLSAGGAEAAPGPASTAFTAY
jgi:hypothetical protein